MMKLSNPIARAAVRQACAASSVSPEEFERVWGWSLATISGITKGLIEGRGFQCQEALLRKKHQVDCGRQVTDAMWEDVRLTVDQILHTTRVYAVQKIQGATP